MKKGMLVVGLMLLPLVFAFGCGQNPLGSANPTPTPHKTKWVDVTFKVVGVDGSTATLDNVNCYVINNNVSPSTTDDVHNSFSVTPYEQVYSTCYPKEFKLCATSGNAKSGITLTITVVDSETGKTVVTKSGTFNHNLLGSISIGSVDTLQ